LLRQPEPRHRHLPRHPHRHRDSSRPERKNLENRKPRIFEFGNQESSSWERRDARYSPEAAESSSGELRMKTGKIEQDSKVDPESNLLVRCAETPASNHRPRTPEQKKQLNKIPAFLLSLFVSHGF
jgi:hypothetical protein